MNISVKIPGKTDVCLTVMITRRMKVSPSNHGLNVFKWACHFGFHRKFWVGRITKKFGLCCSLKSDFFNVSTVIKIGISDWRSSGVVSPPDIPTQILVATILHEVFVNIGLQSDIPWATSRIGSFKTRDHQLILGSIHPMTEKTLPTLTCLGPFFVRAPLEILIRCCNLGWHAWTD